MTVGVELVVGAVRDEYTPGRAQGVEDLRRGVAPHPRVLQLGELRDEVELEPLGGPRQGHPPHQQDGQHDVRERSREIHNLKHVEIFN